VEQKRTAGQIQTIAMQTMATRALKKLTETAMAANGIDRASEHQAHGSEK
jgi:hypothetical protein